MGSLKCSEHSQAAGADGLRQELCRQPGSRHRSEVLRCRFETTSPSRVLCAYHGVGSPRASTTATLSARRTPLWFRVGPCLPWLLSLSGRLAPPSRPLVLTRQPRRQIQVWKQPDGGPHRSPGCRAARAPRDTPGHREAGSTAHPHGSPGALATETAHRLTVPSISVSLTLAHKRGCRKIRAPP